MLPKKIHVFAVCFSPFGFRCSIFSLTTSLPLRLIHCCLDTRPLKVIKKSLPSCVQSLCLWKQFSGNSTRKITLLAQTLLFIHEGDAIWPSPELVLLAHFLSGRLFCSQTHTALLESLGRLQPMGPASLQGRFCGPSTLGLGSHRPRCHFLAKLCN